MSDKLTGDFVVELLRACQNDLSFMDVCVQNLKYQYLTNEAEKAVWKEMKTGYDVNDRIPTLGTISEALKKVEGVNEVLSNMKKVKVIDPVGLLESLEEYIKMNMFVESYDKLADQWNDGNKDDAYFSFADMGKHINEFSLRAASTYSKVFEDFEARNKERLLEVEDSVYDELGSLTFGIDPLDHFSRGRLNKGDTVLFTAQSGIGKSLVLRWIAMSNARRGRRVVHFQGEDTKKLCMQYYDALWTGEKIDNIEKANISQNKLTKLKKNLRNLKSGRGEILVHAFEDFGSASLLDCRQILDDIRKTYGEIDVIIWDYLEKFEPGDGKRYNTNSEGERMRRAAVGDKMKNLAMEFDSLGVTATQASSVKRELLNNPDWFMTRENVSEFKAIVNPFSWHYTINQTQDEYENEYCRIYVDKQRKAKSGQLVPIYMSRDNGRFYNKEKTLEYLWDKEKKKVVDA